MYFGSHVSIRKGYLGAAEHALVIGAKSFQFFPKNPRSLGIKKFDYNDAEHCSKFTKKHNIISITHTSYPTNLATEGVERERVIDSVLNDLEITEACGSIGLVVHFGIFSGNDPLTGYQNIIITLNKILSSWNGNAVILLENQAGQGVKMGITIEELIQIRNLIDQPEKIAFCLDTCHAFASGMWTGDNHKEFLIKGDQLHYLPLVKAVHLNDSKFPTNSFRDRHENIGKGFIGEKHFRTFLLSDFLQKLPIILETPSTCEYSHQNEIIYLNKLMNIQ